jgi:hypothetical protein
VYSAADENEQTHHQSVFGAYKPFATYRNICKALAIQVEDILSMMCELSHDKK